MRHRRDIFDQRFTVTPGCWIWAATDKDGYGAYGGTTAHRASYELYVGPIPVGMEIDHLCRVRACVNPSHLEVVTRAENVRRQYADMSACKRGHEFTPENTHIYRNKRVCRACNAAAQRRVAARRKAVAS